jgi:glycosyltransferase involved in cell wall biosynthesis
MQPPRVLHTPHNVGMNPQGLARAERELGLASVCVTFTQNYRDFETDEVLLDGTESWPEREWKRVGLLRRALSDFDVVHFSSGQSLFPVPDPTTVIGNHSSSSLRRLRYGYARLLNMNDLAVLRRAGKVIAVTYQGDDARQGASWGRPGSPFEVRLATEVDYYTPAFDEARRRMIGRFDRSAHLVYYLNPDLGHVLPPRAEFMPYSHIDLREWQPVPFTLEDREPPLVVHAPFHQGVKGTRFVLAAVERLRADGIPFEFRLVEKLTHAEARRVYERAHLLVDQLLLGWYGGIAVELMALGRPVVAHIRSSDLHVLPPGMADDLPVVDATPETVYEVLRELLTTRRGELAAIGARGRAYVERWHDPLRTAARLSRDYEGVLERIRR